MEYSLLSDFSDKDISINSDNFLTLNCDSLKKIKLIDDDYELLYDDCYIIITSKIPRVIKLFKLFSINNDNLTKEIIIHNMCSTFPHKIITNNNNDIISTGKSHILLYTNKTVKLVYKSNKWIII